MEWNEFKGNCRYRFHVAGADGCGHNEQFPDDCEEFGCPLRKFTDHGNEMVMSQCDKCGSEVPHDEIDWEMYYKLKHILLSFAFGIGTGIAGALLVVWLVS